MFSFLTFTKFITQDFLLIYFRPTCDIIQKYIQSTNVFVFVFGVYWCYLYVHTSCSIVLKKSSTTIVWNNHVHCDIYLYFCICDEICDNILTIEVTCPMQNAIYLHQLCLICTFASRYSLTRTNSIYSSRLKAFIVLGSYIICIIFNDKLTQKSKRLAFGKVQ